MERLKELRLKKKLSQKELAEELGITQEAVSFLETGKRNPSYELLKKISKYFDVSVDDLFLK